MTDISRFLGCCNFPDEAGFDLENLLVSAFRHGVFKEIITSKVWRSKGNYLRSLKISLKHLIDYLENEQRNIRAFGGLTTALHSIGAMLEYNMSALQKGKEAARRNAKATKDAKIIEDWVGSEVYKEMTLKAFQCLKYIHSHAYDEGFWDKHTHLLANQMLANIVFLNTYPGRCGGREQILNEEMNEQLDAVQIGGKGVLTFVKHKTYKTYGHLNKWVPVPVLKALEWYRSLPLGERQYFITSHTPSDDAVIMSHILQMASDTLGHPGAVPNTNFIRKLYHSTVSSAGGVGERYNEDLKDLADIDAHAYAMAKSIHYDLSDRLDGPMTGLFNVFFSLKFLSFNAFFNDRYGLVLICFSSFNAFFNDGSF